MMASRATAVLPVCRSPMMSCRWPRPMAVMASMALMPVCSGSFTGCRWTTEGACSSSASRISSGRIVSSVTGEAPLFRVWVLEARGSAGEPPTRVVELADDAAVEELVADAHRHAADERRVDDDLQPHVAAEAVPKS